MVTVEQLRKFVKERHVPDLRLVLANAETMARENPDQGTLTCGSDRQAIGRRTPQRADVAGAGRSGIHSAPRGIRRQHVRIGVSPQLTPQMNDARKRAHRDTRINLGLAMRSHVL